MQRWTAGKILTVGFPGYSQRRRSHQVCIQKQTVTGFYHSPPQVKLGQEVEIRIVMDWNDRCCPG